MRINSVIYTPYTRACRTNVFKGESPANPVDDRNIEQIKLNNATYYYLPSLDDRTYTSESKELIDIPSHFAVNVFDNVPCPACGQKMLPKAKFEEFVEQIDSADSSEYIDILWGYKDYMRPVEFSVLKEITNLSQSTGEKDIRKLLVQLRDTKLPALQKVQLKKVKKMEALAKSLPENERSVLLSKVTLLKKNIRQVKSESPFRRKRLIDVINNIKIGNLHKREKLREIAKSFPTSADMNSAWIVKYSGKNKYGQDWASHDIAIRLLEFSVPNTDHILARAIELNHDDINNYMSMHQSCNGQKAAKPFLEWYYEDKTAHKKGLTDYFNKVNELVKSGQIKDLRYANYVANATQLIRSLTDGKVDIEIKQ
ncbi:hypothetical protein II906_09870 [bacterium]|nr:hypothetical protein [bacterium]